MPLVLAHGFTQTGRLWGAFGAALARHRRLVHVDLPGHGGSAALQADLRQGADLLLRAGGDEPFDLLGYSLGGRFALQAALAEPARVRRLVLVSTTAGIEDPAARLERRRRDEALADEIERSNSLEHFLSRWLANPMFATLAPGAAQIDERRRNSPAGLASSLRLAGVGAQPPLWDDLGALTMPVLCLAGANDPRFLAHGARIARATGGCFSVIPGAGHAAHLEQPGIAGRIVTTWLDRVGTSADRRPRRDPARSESLPDPSTPR